MSEYVEQEQVTKWYNELKHLYIIEDSLCVGAVVSAILKDKNICPCCWIKNTMIVNQQSFICLKCGGLYEKPIKQKPKQKIEQYTLF